ncbi:nucleotide disphospho-sugar-binding domain-containing protein [Streptomyces sp. NPDC051214]|uniref:nucleotide disphospho-sugar-binding domain-containing protein n=1 Tax=Streptomyces sp. NPDC051214 TaxID=3155282 RepID=UPI0034275C60
MRVLFISTPSASHFTPLAPLAWALRGAGHDVVVAGQPDIDDAVRASGFVGRQSGAAFDGEAVLLRGLEPWQRPLQVRPRERLRIEGYAQAWSGHAARVVRGHLDFARAYRPDLIVGDPLEYSTLVIGRALDVPVVHHRWGVDSLASAARGLARENLRELCEELGVGALPDPAVILDPCPPSLQQPGAEPGLPVRHVPYSANWRLPEDFPWEAPQDGRRRVGLSLGGTLRLNGAGFVVRLLRAIGEMPDIEVLATLPAEFRGLVGEVPARIRCVGSVPLGLLLDHCAAVVHHGGSGTSMTATLAGLPQLVLPQIADNFGHGDRLAHLGAAVALDTAETQDAPKRLRDALTDLLDDPRYTEAAGRLRAEMLLMPTPAGVVDDLANL